MKEEEVNNFEAWKALNNSQRYYCEPKYIEIKTTLWLGQRFLLHGFYSRSSESILNNQSARDHL